MSRFRRSPCAGFGDRDERAPQHVTVAARALEGAPTAYQRVYEVPRERYELSSLINAANPAAWDSLTNRVEVKALVGRQMLISTVTTAGGSDSWLTCRPTRDRDPVDDTELAGRLEESPRTGQPRAVTSNIEMILRFAQALRGTYTFDVLRKRVVVTSGPIAGVDQDDLGIAAASWLGETWKLHAQSTRSIGELLFYCARRFFSVDPVVKYLDSLKWDGTKRIDCWLPTYLRVEDTPYTRAIGAKWLISAVARARNPGSKADCTLVLTGEQGYQKSSALEVLGGEFYLDGSAIDDLADKDSRMIVATGWIVELPEMTAVLRSRHRESVKAFLSCREDTYRLPYGRTVSNVPRRCVISMTTNDQQFLTDETGNRRYWIAKVPSRVDLDSLARDRDQLWAEAYERYRQFLAAPSDQDRWWLTDAEQVLADEVADKYREANPWAETLCAHLQKYPPFAHANSDPVTLATLGAVLGVRAVDLPRCARDIAKAARAAGLTSLHTEHGNRWQRR